MTDRPPAPPYGQPGAHGDPGPYGDRPAGPADPPRGQRYGEPANPGTPADADPYPPPAPYGQRYGEPAASGTPADGGPGPYPPPAPYGEPAPPPYGDPGPPPYGEPGTAPPPYGQPYGDPGAYPVPYGTRPPRPRLWPPTRAEWGVAAAAVAALALLGLALAPLWVQLAPRLAFRVDQPGRALPVVPEAEEYVAADGRFVLLTLAAGVLAGLVCWFGRRSRGPLVLFALAAGGLLGAVLTWRLGLRLGTGYRAEDLQVVGRTVYQPLLLRAKAALVVEPFAAVLVYLLGVGFSARNDLGRGDEDPDGLSSGSG